MKKILCYGDSNTYGFNPKNGLRFDDNTRWSALLGAKLKDICQFSFNFDNLMKVVDYLFRNNVIIIREIKDLKNRVTTLETLESEIEKLKIKTTKIENTNDNINRSFIDMKERFTLNAIFISFLHFFHFLEVGILNKNRIILI